MLRPAAVSFAGDSREPLFRLLLDALDMGGLTQGSIRPPTGDDLALLTDWLCTHHCEVLGAGHNANLREDVAARP